MKKSNIDKKLLKIEEAINLIKESKERKFIESLDLAVNLSIDPKQSNQMVKGSIVLPEGSGKKVKVIVISANESSQEEGRAAGAIEVGSDNLIQKIEKGFLDFDCCIATPDIMQKLSKVAKKLGPRGLMPSPRNGTVTNNIKKATEDALKGKVNYRNDKSGIIHCLAGKINFSNEDLISNIRAILKSIKDARPENSKGKYIKSMFICATMGTSIEVALESLN